MTDPTSPPTDGPPTLDGQPDGPAPPPATLPADVWARVLDHLRDPAADDPADIAAHLLAWCDGRSADDLEQILDALRDRGAYPISLEVLEAAWNSDLPLDRLGRVAEDWIGTVLHGLGDRDGAREVAAHLARTAAQHGPQFEGDLGHVLLGWELPDLAAPLIERAAAALPGDLATQFNLGLVCKHRGDWPAAAAAFRLVLTHHDEPAARWNLGIAAVALRDWPTARACWTALGIALPPGDGDYLGAPGDPVAVRVSTAADSMAAPVQHEIAAPVHHEILWADRLGPARAVLRGIARYSPLAYGDIVLIDGAPVAEAHRDGRPHPVVPCLGLFAPGGGRRVALGGPPATPAHRRAAAALVSQLNNTGWPAADLTGADRRPHLYLALIIPPGRDPADALALIEPATRALPVDLAPLHDLAQRDLVQHDLAQRALKPEPTR